MEPVIRLAFGLAGWLGMPGLAGCWRLCLRFRFDIVAVVGKQKYFMADAILYNIKVQLSKNLSNFI